MRPEMPGASLVAREALFVGARGFALVVTAALGSRPSMPRLFRLFLVAFVRTLRSRWAKGPAMPSWSFSFEWIVRFLRADWDDARDWPMPKIRADYDARPLPAKHVRNVTTKDETVGGVPCRRFVPKGKRGEGIVVYFHGGSYFYGSSKSTHQELVSRIAIASGREVIGVEYRLAPEHTYPAQRDDALAVVDALVADGTAIGDLVLAGDSAGGNLVLAAAQALRDRTGSPRVAGLVLLSPWSDLTMPGASFVENDASDYGDREGLVRHAAAFVGDVALDDPRVSPVYANLTDLPPCLVEVGTAEIPRDDILALAKKLAADGVDTILHEAKEMPHNAAVFSDLHPEGERALQAIARFVRERLSR
jgi:monoterpene epsilon-lactone hydrolase